MDSLVEADLFAQKHFPSVLFQTELPACHHQSRLGNEQRRQILFFEDEVVGFFVFYFQQLCPAEKLECVRGHRRKQYLQAVVAGLLAVACDRRDTLPSFQRFECSSEIHVPFPVRKVEYLGTIFRPKFFSVINIEHFLERSCAMAFVFVGPVTETLAQRTIECIRPSVVVNHTPKDVWR